MGGGDGNGGTEGPLSGVGGYSSWCIGERVGAVTATGGTVTPDGSLMHLTCVAHSMGVLGTCGCQVALRGLSKFLVSTKETRVGFSPVLYTIERRAGTMRAFLRFQLERTLHATKASETSVLARWRVLCLKFHVPKNMAPITVREAINDLAEVERRSGGGAEDGTEVLVDCIEEFASS